jgi:hypothetical protein
VCIRSITRHYAHISAGDFSAKPTDGTRVYIKLEIMMEHPTFIVMNAIMYPCCSIHKYTWTSPDSKTCYEVDHGFNDGRRHSLETLVSTLSEVFLLPRTIVGLQNVSYVILI